MTFGEFVRRALAVAAIATLFIVLGLLLWRLRSVVLIAFTCWIIAVALNVPVTRLQGRGMKRGQAILVTLVGVVTVMVLLFIWLVPPIVEQMGNLIQELPDAARASIGQYAEFRERNDSLQEFLPDVTVENYDELLEQNVRLGEGGAFNLNQIADNALPILGGLGSIVADVSANVFIIIIIALYILSSPTEYYRVLLALLPTKDYTRALDIINQLQRVVIAWISSLAISISATATLTFIGLGLLLQVPNALALGVLAGLGAFVPYVGYYFGLIPIILFTLADDPNKLLLAVPLYVVIGEIESKVITPNVVKQGLNIPAGIMLLFQLVSISLFGFFGLLLAVPLLAAIRVLVRELYVIDILRKENLHYDIEQDEEGEWSVTHLSAEARPVLPSEAAAG